MRLLKRGLAALFVLALATLAYAYSFASHQGRQAIRWSDYTVAKVEFDANGIPTIEGKDWPTLVEAQGFVTASDRLWQMDLMRHSGAGRLSEWFGNLEKAIAFDEKRRKEDWSGTADKAAAALSAPERALCDAFAKGVNQFIEENPKRWGIEYTFLGARPESWECRDSLLILLSMVEDLTEAYKDEAQGSVWRKYLSPSWEKFLFTLDHPWNVPLFDKASTVHKIEFPEESIASSPVDPSDASEVFDGTDFVYGSNAWAYHGPKGTFLASDPHLSYGVPQLWYPVRLQISANEWALGASLPGIPGIVIGRNAKIAWGFTNAAEDVDDLLEEEISEDGKQYVASKGPNGRKVWKAIEERPYEVKIKGAASRTGVARFTHRGPLDKREYLGEALYSRQWLGLQPGILRLPFIVSATDWASFNTAVDAFAAPAQAIVFADLEGNLGIRVSGRGVKRKKTGLIPQRAIEGEWGGLMPISDRRRLFVPVGKKASFVSTANQRLWTSGFGEHWSSESRQERIRGVLGASGDLSRDDMGKLQHDTQSRFLKTFLQWLATHATPQNDKQKAMVDAWKAWDGFAQSSDRIFAQAILGRQLFASSLLGRVRKRFLPMAAKDVPYRWKMDTAWQLRILEAKESNPLAAFGLKASELADWLLQEIERKDPQGYAQENRWVKQHPFSNSVPLIGSWFRVDEHPQVGFAGVVRVEESTRGASMRLIFDMTAPDGGQWAFPVGQSGHFLSPYYRNFRKLWYEEKYLPSR